MKKRIAITAAIVAVIAFGLLLSRSAFADVPTTPNFWQAHGHIISPINPYSVSLGNATVTNFTVTGTCTGCGGVASGTGISTLNGQTGTTQTFATNTTATGLTQTITSSGNVHTWNLGLTSGYIIPLSASTTNWNTFYNTPSSRITAGTNVSWSGNTLNGAADSHYLGLLSGTSPITYNSGTGAIGFNGSGYQPTVTLTTTGVGGAATFSSNILNIPQYQTAGSYVTNSYASSTFPSFSYSSSTFPSFSYASSSYQLPITLTTTGSSGAATFSGNTLNIPQYSGGGGGGSISTSTTAQIGKSATWTGLATLGNGAMIDNGTVTGINASSSTITFNIQGNAGNFDPFNVASSSGTSYLRVTRAGNVGIGVTAPTHPLVVKTGSSDGAIFSDDGSYGGTVAPLNAYKNSASSGDALFVVGSANQNNQFVVRDQQAISLVNFGVDAGNLHVGNAGGKYQISSANSTSQYIDYDTSVGDNMLLQTSLGNSSIILAPKQTTVLTASSTAGVLITGNVGVGTTTPRSAISVTSGDVEVASSTRGIILHDTTNYASCYRVQVTSGSIVPTSITCP